MSEPICEDFEIISISGTGPQTILEVSHINPVRFLVDTAALEATLRGVPVQVSCPQGYCRIELVDEDINVTFSLQGQPQRRCTCPKNEFARIMSAVRLSA